MESQKTEAEKSQHKSVKTRFGEVLNAAYDLFKKNALMFMGLYAASVVLGVLVSLVVGLLPFLKGDEDTNLAIVIAVAIAVIVVNWMVQLLGMNTVLRGAWLTDNNKFSFQEAFTSGLNKIGKAMGLSVRIFFYTGVWAIMLVGFLAFGSTLMSVLGMKGGIRELEGLTSFVGPFSTILYLVLIVLLIVMIKRICSAVFAFPILMSRDAISGKDALKESISLSSGFTGTVFSNYFLFGLLSGIATAIMMQIFAPIVGAIIPRPDGGLSEIMEYSQNVATYAGIIPGILVGSFGIIFQYAFMKKMIEEKSDQTDVKAAG